MLAKHTVFLLKGFCIYLGEYILIYEAVVIGRKKIEYVVGKKPSSCKIFGVFLKWYCTILPFLITIMFR
jgi:hypothetical protein